MNPNQIQLVQQSFEQVKPIVETAADLFYDRLFELDPGLRPMFKSDLSEQKRNLMTTLSFAVSGLKKPERILPAVRQLGARHAGYGVQERPYSSRHCSRA
jgi:hemoglobin-like flavoprotein